MSSVAARTAATPSAFECRRRPSARRRASPRASPSRSAVASSSITWPAPSSRAMRRVRGAHGPGPDHGDDVVEAHRDVLVAADRHRTADRRTWHLVGQPLGDAEQVLERDLGDRHELGVGALIVEAHELAVARTGARCRCGTDGSARTTASRCSGRARRPRSPPAAISSAARGPISISSPLISWPRTHGGVIRRSPLKKVRTSVPQMPQAVTRRSTPSEGHLASSTEPTLISPGPSQIAARTASSPHRFRLPLPQAPLR